LCDLSRSRGIAHGISTVVTSATQPFARILNFFLILPAGRFSVCARLSWKSLQSLALWDCDTHLLKGELFAPSTLRVCSSAIGTTFHDLKAIDYSCEPFAHSRS